MEERAVELPQHILLDEEETDGPSDIENHLRKGGSDSTRQDDNEKDLRIKRNYGMPYPRHFGRYSVFKFKEGEPTIAIGPHCKRGYAML